MKSTEYRKIISTIIKNLIKKRLPGIELKHIKEISFEASKAIHARMYGANVDGVDSPIWRDYNCDESGRKNCIGANQYSDGKVVANQPKVEASELLK